MADYTVSSHIDNFMQGLNAAESRAELGLGTLSTVSGGTGVATALAVNTGTAGSFVVNGGVLGTPSSGTVTNLTGTASININGTVGATTPNTGSFTTLVVSGMSTLGMTSVTSATFPPLVAVRTGTATNIANGGFAVNQTTTNDAVDGFGARIVFTLTDSGVSNSILGYLDVVRSGADNSGSMIFLTGNAGAPTEVMRCTPNSKLLVGFQSDQGTGAVQILGGLGLDKTITPAGTTGARTINKAAGSVNLAASATSLVVTNSLVTTNSVIMVTVTSNDTTAKTCSAVAAAGSFTIRPNAAPGAETRVDFLVIN